jgi:hypothetical protein
VLTQRGSGADHPADGGVRLAAKGLALAFLSFAVQIVVYLGFFGYCDENLRVGSSREAVCDVASPWGYGVLLILPPCLVACGGVVAAMRSDGRVLWWAFGGALGGGIGIPLILALAAGY